jgi:hypothetical protein
MYSNFLQERKGMKGFEHERRQHVEISNDTPFPSRLSAVETDRCQVSRLLCGLQ